MAILEQLNLTDAIRPVPASELEARLAKFRQLMDEQNDASIPNGENSYLIQNIYRKKELDKLISERQINIRI